MKILRSIQCRGGKEAEAVQQAKAIAALQAQEFLFRWCPGTEVH